MSSILDALKKLEKESSGDVPIPSSSSKLNARKVFARPAAEHSRRAILTAALSVVVLCGIITIMIRWIPAVFQHDTTSTKASPHHETPPAVHEPVPAISNAMPPLFPVVSIAPEPPFDIIRTGHSPEPKVEPPLELTAVFKPETRETIPETKPPEHAEYIGPTTMDEPKLPDAPPVISITPIPDKKEEAIVESETAENPFREDERVAIQALVWASAVSQRMAVINDRICKIGDQIAGVTVHDIGEDYVELDDGSNRWRQRFSVK